MATACILESSAYPTLLSPSLFICCELATVPSVLMFLLCAAKCHSVFPVGLALHLGQCQYKAVQWPRQQEVSSDSQHPAYVFTSKSTILGVLGDKMELEARLGWVHRLEGPAGCTQVGLCLHWPVILTE